MGANSAQCRLSVLALLKQAAGNLLLECARTALLLVGGVGIGVLLGHLAWGIIGAIALFLCWHGLQAHRLIRSFQPAASSSVPPSRGFWRALSTVIAHHTTHSTQNQRQRSRKLLGALEQIRHVGTTMPDAIIILDHSGHVEYSNQAAAQLLHLTSAHYGQPLTALSGYQNIMRLLSDAESESFTIAPAPNNPNVFLDVRMIPFGDSKQLMLLRDVTRFQHLETVRQDFVANVSHELRTPLTTVLGYLETMTDDAELEADGMRAILLKMQRPAQRMRALVEDLLLLSRLDSTAGPAMADMTPLKVDKLIQDILPEAADIGNNHHRFLVETDPGLLLFGIEPEIRSAFSNLIINAVRYSPDGGDIRISWYAANQRGRFEVQDEGIGIAAKHLPRLTERFYRVDNDRSRSRGGTGLGLAIVKHVLRRHGSELRITSAPDEGSVFACSFSPTQIKQDSQPRPPPASATPALNKTIAHGE